MKKTMLVLMAVLALFGSAAAQDVWQQLDKMIAAGSYKSAFAKAQSLYANPQADARQRLTAVRYMGAAASYYQEDAFDSVQACLRRLLPVLPPLERALCYAMMGQYDSALTAPQLLQQTRVEDVKPLCTSSERGEKMTPTVYDMLVVQMQDDYDELTPRQRVELQQKLCAFHETDVDDELRLWHEMRLLEMMERVPNNEVSDGQYLDLLDRFRTSRAERVTLIYSRLAMRCMQRGQRVEALAYCDSAIARAPKSEGGIDCANMRAEILKREVHVTVDRMPAAKEYGVMEATCRNVSHLWMRVVECEEYWWYGDKWVKKLLKEKAVSSWDVALPTNDRYDNERVVLALPPLEIGHYALLVSPNKDFKSDDLVMVQLEVTDFQLVRNGADILLIDRVTGQPIEGQEVMIESTCAGKNEVVKRAVSDKDGVCRLDIRTDRFTQKVIERGGKRFHYSDRESNPRGTSTAGRSVRAELRTDRPIYRPGDSMQVAVLLYECDGVDGTVIEREKVSVILRDPNWKVIAEDSAFTDDYGIVQATFYLPQNCLPGMYGLTVSRGNTDEWSVYCRVEEYKQPRFMVSLDGSQKHSPEMGRDFVVGGMAKAYNGTPLGGARVSYTVECRVLARRWWWSYGFNRSTRVASGEAVCGNDGGFEVHFVPQPDSSIELSTKPTFEYVVTVDVTDLNGESHNAVSTFRVGYRNAFINYDGKEAHLVDINGKDLPGEVHAMVQRLRQPTTPLLETPFPMAKQTMSRAEWQQRFPHIAYDTSHNAPSTWPVERTERGDHWRQRSGVYRLTFAAEGADTLVLYEAITAEGEADVQSQELLWAEADHASAEVGERVKLRIGSRFEGVKVYYSRSIGGEEQERRWISLKAGKIETIELTVDSSMLGGFQMDLVATFANCCVQKNVAVDVPFGHKRLQVDVSTFRDRLLPGESEQWTIRVATDGVAPKPQQAALIMTMYDDALNSYGMNDWGFSPWRKNYTSPFSLIEKYGTIGNYIKDVKYKHYGGKQPVVWRLWENEAYRYGMPYVGGTMVLRSVTQARGMKHTMVREANAVQRDMVEPESASFAEELAYDDDAEEDGGNGSTAGSELQIRSNLSPLAFFVADVKTDSNGVATYSFAVPELLTRWRVLGLAVSRDLKIGTMDRTLVTAKPLMVQPNMPRFLRQGDSLGLMVKVMRDQEGAAVADVEVSLLLTDAATGDTICHMAQSIDVEQTAQVIFPVEVPRGVYVVQYEVRGVATGVSDGERGQLPVVSSREAVTASQAVYINGAGERHFALKGWPGTSDSREPLMVAAEMTSNPLWLAAKAMPRLADMQNPSTLYLADQLYVSLLGLRITSGIDSTAWAQMIAEQTDGRSRLRENDEVRQQALEATPWLRAAESEERQMAEMVQYFDRHSLDSTLADIRRQIVERQNDDGGWAWMPEGRSSCWATQQVLRRMAADKEGDKAVKTKALQYIDRENQDYYNKNIKPYLKKANGTFEPTNIDYLYVRSFYGKATTEAYKYYYTNALKTYGNYENLYTQAQLALIFYRNGDRKEAKDLLRRLREKSLESDELGLYWRDNRSGWYWYSRPIETQALLIQAFAEIEPDDSVGIGQMQQWLLKQKQTTHWGNSRATAEAIAALASQGFERREGDEVRLSVLGEEMKARATGLKGYSRQSWTDDELEKMMAKKDSTIVVKKEGRGIAWGAVYYQYTDEVENLPASEMGISLHRTYIMPEKPTVGDRITVRIEISCDRAMDYLELVDARPSCTEPLSTRAGWRYSGGLAYYMAVGNTDTRFYIEHLDRGHYVAEYELYLTNPGTFVAAPARMQCMYAPEFRCNTRATRLTVEE